MTEQIWASEDTHRTYLVGRVARASARMELGAMALYANLVGRYPIGGTVGFGQPFGHVTEMLTKIVTSPNAHLLPLPQFNDRIQGAVAVATKLWPDRNMVIHGIFGAEERTAANVSLWKRYDTSKAGVFGNGDLSALADALDEAGTQLIDLTNELTETPQP